MGEVSNLLTGFPFESKKFTREGIKLVRGMNVKRGYLDFSEELCECWASSLGLESYLLKNGDILIQMDGALIGKSYAKIEENQLPALLVQRVTRVRALEQVADEAFIYQQIQKGFLAYIKGTKTETAVPHLSLNDIENFTISIPSFTEQKKVGDLFESLDDLITLHQREFNKLLNVKKSMLEKMFPKNESNIPEIRFKGFTDPWEQRKLGDCFTERVESMPDGELISVTINDGIKKFSELGRHNNSNDDKSKYKKVCIGDIAYNSMRMWQGASGYSPYEGIVSPAYTVLSPNSGINSKCLAYQFKLPEMIHTFQINSQGITSDNWNLKYPALSEIEIFVSKNEKEQAKIAEYFEGLDRLITLHQRELEKLQNIKKSMLEKMFV